MIRSTGSAGGRLLPQHRFIGEDEVSAETRQKLQESLVLVHGGDGAERGADPGDGDGEVFVTLGEGVGGAEGIDRIV